MSHVVASCRLAGQALDSRLWLIDLDAATADDGVRLSPSEEARSRRFVFARDRLRYVAAHRALRAILQREAGLAGAEEFVLGPHGKPALARAAAVSFNLSHSDRWAVVALTAGAEIGVDVEVLRPMNDLEALAQQNFGATELRELAAENDPGCRLASFFRGWTRKEACLKAIGSGLTIEPASFQVGLGEETRRVAIDSASGSHQVQVVSFEFPAGILAALARVE